MKRNTQLKPIAAGVVAALIVLFLLNAQLIIANLVAWISPGSFGPPVKVPEVTQSKLGNDRIIIPKINVEAPLITDMRDTTESKVQKSLESGVVNFGQTALPGQGNAVVVGHSSNNVWSAGEYKFVFALLDRVKQDDKIYVIYKNVRYEYKVQNSKVVDPNDTSVLQSTGDSRVTLITCTPVGTAINRLVVTATQVSPAYDPTKIQRHELNVTTLPGN